jgi:hypothetical protein
MPRLHRVPRPCDASILAEFYRQELLRHRDCLEQQREYYSDRAIAEAERGLMRLSAQLDRLCANGDAADLVAHLLRQFDLVTGLSAYSAMTGPERLH